MFTAIFEFILQIPSLVSGIGKLWSMIQGALLNKKVKDKDKAEQEHSGALEKAQQDGNVDAQTGALSGIVNDHNS